MGLGRAEGSRVGCFNRAHFGRAALRLTCISGMSSAPGEGLDGIIGLGLGLGIGLGLALALALTLPRHLAQMAAG